MYLSLNGICFKGGLMKRVLFFSIMAIGLLPFFSCEKAKDVLVVDYRMNVAQADYDSNYFNWSFGEKKIEDKFDTVSQASMNKTTGEFNAVRYAGRAEDKKLTLPAGLRGLFFYPIADWSLAEGDALQVQEEGGVVTVKFVHHGKAFMLSTNDKGEFDVLTGSMIAKDFAEKGEGHQYTIKDEYLLQENSEDSMESSEDLLEASRIDPTMMQNLNWEALTMNPDKYSSDAAHHFEGKLKFEFKDNILSIKGQLQKI